MRLRLGAPHFLTKALVQAHDAVLAKRGLNDSYLSVLQAWYEAVPATAQRATQKQCADALVLWLSLRTGGS